jgi:hypothetical protein
LAWYDQLTLSTISVALICDFAIMYTSTNGRENMTKLITATQKHFGGEIVNGVLNFSFGEDGYHLTEENRIYATVDGMLLPGNSKVRNLLAVENFVAERAE